MSGPIVIRFYFLLGFMLIFGIMFIIAGVYTRMGRFSRSSNSKALWQKELVAWGVFGRSDDVLAVQEDTIRCWNRIQSSGLFGAGSVFLLIAIGGAIISLVVTGTLMNTFIFGSPVFLAVLFLVYLLGYGSGYAFAVWRMRSTMVSGVTYSELRPRQLSDYRLGVLRWIPLALIMYDIALTLMFVPHIGSTIHVGEPFSGLQSGIWILAVLPVLMLLIFLLVEALLLRLTGLSRLLITSNPRASQHADDMLRASAIGLTQSFGLAAIGFLSSAQWDLISRNLSLSHYWTLQSRPFDSLFYISLFLAAAVQIIGFALLMCRGRIGGKFTGWPWKARIAQ